MDSLIGIVFLLTVYMTPAIIAVARKHQQRYAIWALNFLLGWTVIGWIIAMIWAVSAVTPPPQNIVINNSNT